LQQPRRIEKLKGSACVALSEHTCEFVADALPAHLMNLAGESVDRCRRALFDREAKSCGEPDRAEHAQLVFFQAQTRIADSPNQSRMEIGASADEVEQRAIDVGAFAELFRIEQHAVDGEVAAFDVFFSTLGKTHGVGMSAVGIGSVVAKCSDFGYEFSAVCFIRHQHHTKVSANGEGLGKHLQNDFGMGVGCDVEVFRLSAQKQIAHTSASEPGLISLGPQTLDDVFGRLSLNHHSSSMEYVSKLMELDAGRSENSGSGLILGIESSCDETAAAVVCGGRETLSNVVASQIATHAKFGGVVPELASREHLRNIVPVVRAALDQSGVGMRDIDAVAVTCGPGLAGALLVGITYAKSLAYALGKPLIAVNHLEGHIHAVLLEAAANQQEPIEPPILALVVSGGHTHLYLANYLHSQDADGRGSWHYRNVGKTVDDAAGEAFDKVAKLLGLPYPGGPWIDALAPHGDPKAVPFAFAQVKNKAGKKRPVPEAGEPELKTLFSFSGIKTAVLRYVETHDLKPSAAARQQTLVALANPRPHDAITLCDAQTLNLIASFQHAVVGDLLNKTFRAAGSLDVHSLLVTGGVAANCELRARFTAEAAARNLPIAFPSLALSTDNAAMIAAAAWPKFVTWEFAGPSLNADPSLRLGRD
jgi:N6-L-threonylcarbamoyladenine synthase